MSREHSESLTFSHKPENVDLFVVNSKGEQRDLKELEYWVQLEIEMPPRVNPGILREINFIFRFLFKLTATPVQGYS